MSAGVLPRHAFRNQTDLHAGPIRPPDRHATDPVPARNLNDCLPSARARPAANVSLPIETRAQEVTIRYQNRLSPGTPIPFTP